MAKHEAVGVMPLRTVVGGMTGTQTNQGGRVACDGSRFWGMPSAARRGFLVRGFSLLRDRSPQERGLKLEALPPFHLRLNEVGLTGMERTSLLVSYAAPAKLTLVHVHLRVAGSLSELLQTNAVTTL